MCVPSLSAGCSARALSQLRGLGWARTRCTSAVTLSRAKLRPRDTRDPAPAPDTVNEPRPIAVFAVN